MSSTACMGGWCTKREKCPHFHATDRREPAERLCPPGLDGELFVGLPGLPFLRIPLRHTPARQPETTL